MMPSSHQTEGTVKSKSVETTVRNTIVVKKKSDTLTRSTVVTFHEYQRDKVELNKYKLPELKQMAKYNKLTQTGTKSTLIQKLQHFFKLHLAALTLQKIVRGRFVRHVLHNHYRGAAFFDRKRCVNETDFFTLEPLHEIPFQQFFSFTDDHAFTYGFDIQSLILLHRTKEKLINPYNREEFALNIYSRIFTLYHLIRIVFPEYIIPGDIYVSPCQRSRRQRTRHHRRVHQIVPATTNENTMIPVQHNDQNFAFTQYQYTSINFMSVELSPLIVIELMMQLEAKKQMMMRLKTKQLCPEYKNCLWKWINLVITRMLLGC